MPQHEDKNCSKCGDIFECKLGSITICHCFDVPLNREETLYIAQNYNDCLCHKCLVEEKQISRNRENNIPNSKLPS
jgi:hypothetical protein